MAADPPRRRRSWPAAMAAVVGTILLAAAVTLSLSLIACAFMIQLFINIFAVAFTGELRWYGPSLGDMSPGLWQAVLLCGLGGAALVVLAAVWIHRVGDVWPVRTPFGRRRPPPQFPPRTPRRRSAAAGGYPGAPGYPAGSYPPPPGPPPPPPSFPPPPPPPAG